MKRLRYGGILALLGFLVACGGGPAAPPQIVAAYPADGARGVRKNEAIVVTFDRSMDRSATEAAFSLWDPDGKPLSVQFAWEDGDRRMRVTPSQPWRYSDTDQPVYYRYRLSTGAKSAGGAPLAQAFEARFATLRKLEWKKTSSPVLDGAVSDLGYVNNDPSGATAYILAYVGDFASNRALRAFFVFELGDFPPEAVELDQARLRVWLKAKYGSPEADLGSLSLARVDLGAGLDKDDYQAPALGNPLEISPGWVVGAWRELDVSPLFAAAWGEDADRLDLRFAFEVASDWDSAADRLDLATGEYATYAPELVVRYYAP